MRLPRMSNSDLKKIEIQKSALKELQSKLMKPTPSILCEINMAMLAWKSPKNTGTLVLLCLTSLGTIQLAS